MQNLAHTLSKYLFPALLSVMGLVLLFASSEQNSLFKFGGFAVFLVGVLSGLYVKGLISRQVQVILGVVVFAGSAYLAYMDYKVIDDKLEYQKRVALVRTHVIQRLKDIRKAQLAHLKETGRYSASLDSLTWFLKNGQVTIVKKLGALPDSVPTEEMARSMGLITPRPDGWTDDQVLAAGLIVRDTVMVDVLGYIFNESDARTRKTPFYLDSLAFVPFARHRFEMKADVIEISGVKQPVFKAWDPKPFAKQYEVGSLTENSTAGNWNE
jgi:hypothetical protein